MSTEQTPLAELMEMWAPIHVELTALKMNFDRYQHKSLTGFTDAFETRLMELAKEDTTDDAAAIRRIRDWSARTAQAMETHLPDGSPSDAS